MKNLIFIVCVFSIVFVQAQNSSYLDEKNGFKDFTFGDSYNKWKSLLKADDRKSSMSYLSGDFSYEYIGTSPNEIFDVRWNQLFLVFRKNRLYKIEVFFDYVDSWEKGVLNGLKEVFGTSEYSASVCEYHIWRTKDNLMQFQTALLPKYRTKNSTDLSFSLQIVNYKVLKELSDKKKQF